MPKSLQLMDVFDYIIKSWTRCNYDRKRKYHIDFDFCKETGNLIYTIQMYSSQQMVYLWCENKDTSKKFKMSFSYETFIDAINLAGDIEQYFINIETILAKHTL